MERTLTSLALLSLLVLSGCAPRDNQAPPTADEPDSVVVFNITSSAEEDPHAVTMALQLAGHTLDAGRDAVLFFNVRGVTVPTTALAEDLAFHAEPIKTLLVGLAERGAEIHVCPHCMAAMEVEEGDLIAQAVVTDRDLLFSKIGAGTVVFSY